MLSKRNAIIMLSLLGVLILVMQLVLKNIDKQTFNFNINIDETIGNVDWDRLSSNILIKTGTKDIENESYLISHWAGPFSLEIFPDGRVKEATISLAIKNDKSKYDIFQIRGDNGKLTADRVDKTDSAEQLSNKVDFVKVFRGLKRVPWEDVLKELPQGDIYGFNLVSRFNEGDMVSSDRQIIDKLYPDREILTPMEMYSTETVFLIDVNGGLQKLDAKKTIQIKNDSIFVLISVLNETERGYQGKVGKYALVLEV